MDANEPIIRPARWDEPFDADVTPERVARSFFDHLSHYAKHFPDKAKAAPTGVPAGFNPAKPHDESLSCATCHSSSTTEGTMNVVSYEKACAACHENDTHSGNKLPVIGYPQMDMIALNQQLQAAQQPRSLGVWPEDAPNEFPWLILFLLPEDVRAAWQRLAANKVFLYDLSGIKPEQVADVERVSWGIKELFRDLCASSPSETPSGHVGQDEIVHRLMQAGCAEGGALINGLPPDALDQMRQHLGAEISQKIMQEVDDYRAKVYPAPTVDQSTRKPVPPAAAPAPAGGESFGPTPGSTAESFGAPPAQAAVVPPTTGKSFAPAVPATESFGALAPVAAPTAAESFGTPAITAATAPTKSATPRLEPLDRMNWTSSGGWHQEYGTIFYKSTGHADPMLKAWLEHVLEDVQDPLRLATLREGFGFGQGWLSPATGHCLKCHTIEEQRDQRGRLTGAVINWLAYGKKTTAADNDRPLTRFNHMAHLLFADCRQCHVTITQPPAGKEYASSFPGEGSWDAAQQWFGKAGLTHFHGNFEQIAKATCAACHTATKSGDSCLNCHSYHHPAPDGPADMLEWLRFRENNPAPTAPRRQPKDRGTLKPAVGAATTRP